MKSAKLHCAIAIALLAPLTVRANDKPKIHAAAEEVSFPSGELTLKGFLWKPEGDGPFPAIIWNHGSEKRPGTNADLGQFYTSKGYVFFVPHRHGSGRSPGDYQMDLQNQARVQTNNERAFHQRCVQLHELYHKDVLAAVAWLKDQPCVDGNRIAMSGCSFGGIQTLLAAEDGQGIRAFVPFAPAAQSWVNPLLRERLLRAVQNAKAPIFILQAQNDYNLGPSETLGKMLAKKGKPNRAKIYPPFGKTPQQGHWDFAVKGTEVWAPDVLEFLDEIVKRRP